MVGAKKIYTKKGDKGTTVVLGSKDKVSKNDVRIKCCGYVDELNAVIGMLSAYFQESDRIDTTQINILTFIQHKLFNIGTIISSLTIYDNNTNDRYSDLNITPDDVNVLENNMDLMSSSLKPLTGFILPIGSQLVCQCHLARTVCRRVETKISKLSSPNTNNIKKFINRLSDYFFVLARYTSSKLDETEIMWSKDYQVKN
jgi:cob(I)alamin adenosyltransferase